MAASETLCQRNQNCYQMDLEASTRHMSADRIGANDLFHVCSCALLNALILIHRWNMLPNSDTTFIVNESKKEKNRKTTEETNIANNCLRWFVQFRIDVDTNEYNKFQNSH